MRNDGGKRRFFPRQPCETCITGKFVVAMSISLTRECNNFEEKHGLQDYERLAESDVFQRIVEAANEKQQTQTFTLSEPSTAAPSKSSS